MVPLLNSARNAKDAWVNNGPLMWDPLLALLSDVRVRERRVCVYVGKS